ncbi:MAG: hypothetical protein ACTTH5_02695 [Wolinella sp.]
MRFDCKSALLMALLASGAMAAENGVFVGVDLGFMNQNNKAQADVVVKNNATHEKVSLDRTKATFESALKVGYHFDSMHRAYLGYAIDGVAKKDGVEYKSSKLLLGYDYTPELANMWRGVAGIYTGILYREATVQAVEDESVTGKAQGNLFGLKLGAIYEVAKNGDIEFGMKFESASMKNKTVADDDSMFIELKDQKQTNIGLYAGYTHRF